MKLTCFGLLIFMECWAKNTAPPPEVYCSLIGPQIVQFEKMTKTQIAGLSDAQVRALVKMRRDYRRECK